MIFQKKTGEKIVGDVMYSREQPAQSFLNQSGHML